jgi:hypothetical protein
MMEKDLIRAKKRKGIGISNMINRVEAFNGSIHIDSAPGMGCRVSFTIPVAGRYQKIKRNLSFKHFLHHCQGLPVPGCQWLRVQHIVLITIRISSVSVFFLAGSGSVIIKMFMMDTKKTYQQSFPGY